MTPGALVEQLREWSGEGADWQIRAAFDYPRDFHDAVFAAILVGAVEVEPHPEPDEDVIRLTEAWR